MSPLWIAPKREQPRQNCVPLTPFTWQCATSSQSSLTSDSKLGSNLYRERCQIWSLQVHMSNRMTKCITRNAKDTIIELVRIIRIVVTHKLGLKTKIQQSRSSHSLHLETICAGKETQSSFFNGRPICTIYYSNSPLHWVSDTEALSTSMSSACWNHLLAPWCSQSKCHVISSPDIDLHELVTSSKSM